MSGLPNQGNPNNKSDGEKNSGHVQQVQASHVDKGIKATLASIIGDDIFKFIAGLAFVSWMLDEFVPDTHKIFLFAAIAFGLADAVYVLAHKIFKKTSFAIVCWVLYAISLIGIFKNENSPGPTPSPHLTAGLRIAELTSTFLELTNENFFAGSPNFWHWLPMPLLNGHSNVDFVVEVNNNSSQLAEDVEVDVSLPGDWKYSLENGWISMDTKGSFGTPDGNGKFITNSLQSWVFFSPFPLFPSNSEVLPWIKVLNCSSDQEGALFIMLRAKSAKDQRIGFPFVFVSAWTNSDGSCGMVIPPKLPTNGTR